MNANSGGHTIETERLILRPWKETDREPFTKMNADPRVMEYFVSTLTREESDKRFHYFQEKIETRGWGWWAVSVKGGADCIGFIGLDAFDQSMYPVHFSPNVEIGWRLAYDYWGKGYAPEGAIACLQYGFKTLNLNEIVAFTAVQNRRSRSVMEKIGMHRDPKDDFDHPRVDKDHPLCKQVLYRLQRDECR